MCRPRAVKKDRTVDPAGNIEVMKQPEDDIPRSSVRASKLLWTRDASGRLLFPNGHRHECLGDDAAFRTFFLRCHPDDRDVLLQLREDFQTGHEPYETVFRIEDPRGGYRWIVEPVLPAIPGDTSPDRLVNAAFDVTARTVTSRRLTESERQFRNLVDGSLQGLYIHRDWKLLFVNRTAAEIFGYDSPEELLKVGDVSALMAPEEHERLWAYKTARQNGEDAPEYFITKGVKKDGSIIWAEYRVRIVDWNGAPAAQCAVVDVTKRKLAEEARRQSEELFSRVFKDGPMACAIAAPEDGRHYDVNEGWMKLVGYTREEALASSAVELGIWKYPEERLKFVELLEKNGRVTSLETTFRTKSGENVAVQVSAVYVHINGEPRLFVVYEDITERKRTDAALRESEKRFKDIAEVSSDWIWECDENFRYSYLSDRFTQITGQSKQRFLGKTSQEIATNTDREWTDHLADLVAHRPFRDFMSKTEDEAGRIHYWSISGRPVFGPDGSFKGYRGTGTDCTDKVEAEAELIRHRDQLQALVDEATNELRQRADELSGALQKEKELRDQQRQFIATASHEFRTPLAIIDATAQRLKKQAQNNKLEPEDAIARVEKIRTAVQRMATLMESTLSAARMEEGKMAFEIGPCDVALLVLETCARHQEVSASHTITPDLRDMPASIQADTAALEQVFTNLLSNAVKYSPESRQIDVNGRAEDGHVVISVRDYGLGIDAEDLPNMFSKFFRAKSSTGIAGTGIGLHLVKTLVEMHQGSVDVRSARGTGSTFTVRLPIAGPDSTTLRDVQAA